MNWHRFSSVQRSPSNHCIHRHTLYVLEKLHVIAWGPMASWDLSRSLTRFSDHTSSAVPSALLVVSVADVPGVLARSTGFDRSVERQI